MPGSYLLLPNLSCHFPLVAVAGAACPVPGTSSTVSRMVAMALRPVGTSGSWEAHGLARVGESKNKVLDVFFLP